MRPSISKNKGFTLIELLVVIAIIGMLSSVVLASLNTARAKARDAKRAAEMTELRKALELYRSNNADYPNPDNFNFYCVFSDNSTTPEDTQNWCDHGNLNALLSPTSGTKYFSRPPFNTDPSPGMVSWYMPGDAIVDWWGYSTTGTYNFILVRKVETATYAKNSGCPVDFYDVVTSSYVGKILCIGVRK